MNVSVIFALSAAGSLLGVNPPDGVSSPGDSVLKPVPFHNVRLADGFWRTWQRINHESIVPYVSSRLEQSGHLENFAKASGQTEGPFKGEVYFDSDVYKLIEGASYCLNLRPDRDLSARLDRWIAQIAAAQQEDGYLHTYTTLQHPRRRWQVPGRHELYCAGHLLEAGVGRYDAIGEDDLLQVARRLADHMVSVFGPAAHQVRFPPEHQGVELALLRLADATGEDRYARLARFFLEQRGNPTERDSYGVYGQDHAPVSEQSEVVGHAVRAAYMYAAMAELAAKPGPPDYVPALNSLFADLIRGKMFISGGVGLLQQGEVHESFTAAWHLPLDQPDVDTCSVIGLIYWLHRMHLLQPDGRYGDLIERILYNRLLVGVSMDGRRFFYGCPLSSRGPGTFDDGPGAECDATHTRAKWFRCVCCPTNLPRVLATLGGYAYSTGRDELYVDHYLPGRAKLPMGDTDLVVDMETAYPWDGRVRLLLRPAEANSFDLCLRIPGWAVGEEFPGGLYLTSHTPSPITLTINDRLVRGFEARNGYVRLSRRWKAGDVVELQLPMDVRRVKADFRVKSTAGRVALMRGPILYCIEETDHPESVRDLVLPPNAALVAEYRPGLLGGVTVLRGSASKAVGRDDALTNGGPPQRTPVDLLAVPYHTWDNREPGEMVVWLPEEPIH